MGFEVTQCTHNEMVALVGGPGHVAGSDVTHDVTRGRGT